MRCALEVVGALNAAKMLAINLQQTGLHSSFSLLFCVLNLVRRNQHGRKTVITHPLPGTCLWCKISGLRQYRAAVALKVIVGEIPVVRPVAKPFWSPLL